MKIHSSLHFILLLSGLAGGFLRAAELVEVQAVSDRILVLHITDARSTPDSFGLPATTFTNAPLDLELAAQPDRYTLLPSGGEADGPARQALAVARKSKAMHFSAWNEEAPHALDHWIYLEFPSPLADGELYELAVDGLVDNVSAVPFAFRSATTRTEALHVNQVGYVPGAGLKVAYLYHWAGDRGPIDYRDFEGRPFFILSEGEDEAVFEGRIRFRMEQAVETTSPGENPVGYYGSPVWECDFSDFRPADTAEYRVWIPNLGCSFPFEIGPDVYREAFITTLRGLYHHRSGPARGQPWSIAEKPIDHTPGVGGFTVYKSDLRWMDLDDIAAADPEGRGRQNIGFVAIEEMSDRTETVENAWGGYFDAGDFDRHIRHLDISFYLCLAYDLAPGNFRDDEANLPESGNGVPDILDEARWCVDFFMRVQEPDGGVGGWLETTAHPHHGETSWTDAYTDWYLAAPDPAASFKFAGSAAYLACMLREDGRTDPGVIEEYRKAAERAYAWAQDPANRLGDDLSSNRDHVLDLRAFAAAGLYRLTGADSFQLQFLEDNCVRDSRMRPVQGNRDMQHAMWLYLLTEQPDIDAGIQEEMRIAAIAWAYEENLNPALNRACRMAFVEGGPTVVGIGSTTPLCFPLMVAAELTEDPAERELFRSYLFTTADYFLGGNPLNTVWVTTLGDRPFTAVLNHDLWYDGDPAEFPGIVPYGFTAPRFDRTGNVWTTGYGKTTCYPNDEEGTATNWPIHELHFENRFPPMTAEYTVWQNIGPAAGIYGYLCGEAR